jgi:hypothetical protein
VLRHHPILISEPGAAKSDAAPDRELDVHSTGVDFLKSGYNC